MFKFILISYIVHWFSLCLVMLRLRPVLEHLHELPLRQAGMADLQELPLLVKYLSFGCWESSKQAVLYHKNMVLGWFRYQRLWGEVIPKPRLAPRQVAGCLTALAPPLKPPDVRIPGQGKKAGKDWNSKTHTSSLGPKRSTVSGLGHGICNSPKIW